LDIKKKNNKQSPTSASSRTRDNVNLKMLYQLDTMTINTNIQKDT